MKLEPAQRDVSPISCFLITRDEEDVIEACLSSVAGLASEIVVVDSGSRDRTLEIAARYGARIIERAWEGFGPQKQAAERACTHDWVLNLDADEVVSPELALEIKDLFAAAPPPCGFYALPRALVYPGRARPAPTRRDLAVRLYDRTKGGFSSKLVHESVNTGGQTVGRLKQPLLHHSSRSLHHLTDKNLRYAVISAGRAGGTKNPIVLYARLLFGFPVVFLRTYFIRGHCLAGAQGFTVALSVAFAEVLKIATQIESKGLWTDRNGFRRGPLP